MSIFNQIDFGLQIARGLVSGISGINQFGRAPSGVQTTLSDIWSRCDATPTQQVWLAPTAARIHAIVSTSTDDSSAGVGAKTILIHGLNTWSSAETSETITMNGTTNVDTVNSYVIIHRMRVITSGTTSINVGTITATAAVNNSVTALISAGVGRAQMAIYGVPSGRTFYIKRVVAMMNDGGTTTRADVEVRVNSNPDVQTTMFSNRRDLQLVNSGTSGMSIEVTVLSPLVGPCIIKLSAIASTTDVDLSAGFDGYLVTN